MYNAEVLSKFPVVQHFPFGTLFAWEADPSAKTIQASVHTSSQPKSSTVPSSTSSTSAYSSPRHQPPSRAQAPLRNPMADAVTAAPWAKPNVPVAGPGVPNGPDQPNRAPWVSRTPAPPPGGPGTGTSAPWTGTSTGVVVGEEGGTRAPWATKKEG